MRHAELSKLVLLNAPAAATLFVNSGGVSFYGKRAVRHGLVKGASDIVGWYSVGGRAIFTAIEIKRAGEKARPEQMRFLQAVVRAGGIGAVVRDVGELPKVFNPERIAMQEVYDVR